MRIIGIDPGTAICGYGIIDVKGSKLTPVAFGAITTPKELTDSQRLEILFNDLSDILAVSYTHLTLPTTSRV